MTIVVTIEKINIIDTRILSKMQFLYLNIAIIIVVHNIVIIGILKFHV